MIRNGGKFFMIQQAMKSENNELFWLFPGGGVKFLESIEDAVKREVYEETGLEIMIESLLVVSQKLIPNQEYHVVNLTYLASLIGGDLTLESSVAGYGWFTAEEVLNLRLTTLTRAMFLHYLEGTKASSLPLNEIELSN